MRTYYGDILSRIEQEPIWWDEHAVPRFEPFIPKLKANIYSNEVALLEVKCQFCGKIFHVCISDTYVLSHLAQPNPRFGRLLISDFIENKSILYGDPPSHMSNIGGETHRCTGNTMNSIAIKILEYWYTPKIRKPLVIRERKTRRLDAVECGGAYFNNAQRRYNCKRFRV